MGGTASGSAAPGSRVLRDVRMHILNEKIGFLPSKNFKLLGPDKRNLKTM
jgi:hypothetical protein